MKALVDKRLAAAEAYAEVCAELRRSPARMEAGERLYQWCGKYLPFVAAATPLLSYRDDWSPAWGTLEIIWIGVLVAVTVWWLMPSRRRRIAEKVCRFRYISYDSTYDEIREEVRRFEVGPDVLLRPVEARPNTQNGSTLLRPAE